MVVRIFGIIDLFLLAIVPLRFVPGIRSLFLIVQGYDIANPNEKATEHDVPVIIWSRKKLGAILSPFRANCPMNCMDERNSCYE